MDTARLLFSAGIGSLFSSDSTWPGWFLPYPQGQEGQRPGAYQGTRTPVSAG